MSEQIKKNDIYTVTIDGYNSEGMGVARIGGIVVFVKGALKGEVCEILILKVTKRLAYAKLHNLITPSPHRQSSDCSTYPKCGGCGLRHMSYEEELRFKKQKVIDIMSRIGGLNIPCEGIVGSPENIRYRNKAQYPIRTVNNETSFGFYRVGSHDIVPCCDCLLQTSTANEIVSAICDFAKRFSLTPYDEITHSGLIRHVYIRTNHDESEAICCLIINGTSLPHSDLLVDFLSNQFPQLVGILINVNTRLDNVIVGDTTKTIWGRDYIIDKLCGKVFRCSIQSFFQINHKQTNQLYNLAAEYAKSSNGKIGTLLDLYCGVGTVGISMVSTDDKLIGIEIVPQAICDAKENAKNNGLTDALFICDDAGKAAVSLAQRGLRPDVVVVDPPRKGLSDEAIDIMNTLSPDRIVYISCDPATQARDLKKLTEKGYSPIKMRLFDMFPRTTHVESVVLMSKGQW